MLSTLGKVPSEHLSRSRAMTRYSLYQFAGRILKHKKSYRNKLIPYFTYFDQQAKGVLPQLEEVSLLSCPVPSFAFSMIYSVLSSEGIIAERAWGGGLSLSFPPRQRFLSRPMITEAQTEIKKSS